MRPLTGTTSRCEAAVLCNTADFLLENGDDDATAILCAGRVHPYGELRAGCARLAAELAGLGLRPADRVGIVGRNSLFWVSAYLATIKSGLVATPFPTTLTPRDAARSQDLAGCRAVFIDDALRAKFAPAFSDDVHRLAPGLLDDGGPVVWSAAAPLADPDADAALMFTSGTTAGPRAVRITHRNIQANTASIISYLSLDAGDRMFVILPFHYCFGTSLLHTHLRVGAGLVLCDSFTYPETALDLMESTRCTGFAGVPSSFQMLLRLSTFSRRQLPHLAKIQQAGGKLQDVLIDELRRARPGASLHVMYGATEATARLSSLPPSMLDRRRGSIGRGIPGVELRVIGEDGAPVKPGEIGEVVARGQNISPGYFNDPAATLQKFGGGELRTGDLATVDDEGYIFIVDRRDDFIKTWGYRVSSQDIESRVLELPDVVAAAAVGVPDLEAGEAIHAFVTLRPGSDLTTEAILAHCRAGLARHAVPSVVSRIESMPLNASGKIVKAELRRQANA